MCEEKAIWITVTPEQSSDSLRQILSANGYNISNACSGRGICGKCKVKYRFGETVPSKEDAYFFSEQERKEGYRLACTSYPKGEIQIILPEIEEEMKILSDHTVIEDSAQDYIIDIEEKGKEEYAIAVDIGTTTLAFLLMDQRTGEQLQKETGRNHGKQFGADVLSRIQSSKEGKRKELQELLKQDIMNGIRRLVNRSKVERGKVTKVYLAGNTTMEHILLGYHLDSLGTYPFTPVSLKKKEFLFNEMFLDSYLDAMVFVLPGISAFVGADIVSGIYACGLAEKEEVSLLIDLGTNGEMVIGNKERLLATSVAAGPAFEAANISCGVPGINGAISKVMISEGKCTYRTIGGKVPVGICGSGVLELVAQLLKNNIIDDTGAFCQKEYEAGYPIAPGICFTQKDIREVQLAKAAVRAGIEFLVSNYDLKENKIATIYLAGGFGYELNMDAAIQIGMFPEGIADRIKSVGNTSLGGMHRLERDADGEEIFSQIIKKTQEVNLAEQKEFQEEYLSYLNF